MPKKRPPGVHRETNRHGTTVWYFRPTLKSKRTRIRAPYGTREFYEEVDAARHGRPFKARRSAINTLEWAVRQYQQSSAWLALASATRRQRANILRRVIAKRNAAGVPAGAAKLREVAKAHIIASREERAKTPAAARNFLETMRGLFAWALETGHVTVNPCEGVSITRVDSGDGFAPWTEEDCAAFEARWPPGTRERLAYAIFYWTGLRRGDAARFGPQHVGGDVGRIETEKTGERVAFRLEAPLLDAIAAGPIGRETFIARLDGSPRTKESLGTWFKAACEAAGVIGKSAHGLRKAGAVRDAHDGYTESELDAKYGWTGGKMAAKYTRSMNRERLALQASDRAKERTGYFRTGSGVRKV
jgi:integrase